MQYKDKYQIQMQNVTLELSAKPFMDDSEESMRMVFRKLFRQWHSLTKDAKRVSVLFWIADGSEILEFSGDLEQRFEWGYWQGIANPLPRPKHPRRSQLLSGNWFPTKYRPDASPRSYAWLKHLIEICREIGLQETGKRIRIGATFDNGPEFSVSDFKYRRHSEIAQAHSIYPNSFVTCDSVLHADRIRYASYPDGIPEGLSLGTFLGAQYREFSKALGFDYIWLSNGMGFGTETWGISGALFDKQTFYPEKKDKAAKRMLGFWKDFLAVAPGTVIETRGSNYSAGIEMATDAAPLAWLYRTGVITPPVNSPMAAILYNPGYSMAAYLSHIAELPGNDFTFRYYIHDPWFMNSPWLDRYGREPWDLYMPVSASRFNAEGKVETASRLAFLSCDDSYGGMPDEVPQEVIPLLQRALRERPDEAGPFLWLYPFDEYAEQSHLDSVFAEELFFAEALENGAPVNSVISTRNFLRLHKEGKDPMEHSVLIIPVSAMENASVFKAVQNLVRKKQIIFYGSLQYASENVCSLLGLRRMESLNGEGILKFMFDTTEHGKFSSVCHILPVFNGGGLCETAESAIVSAEAEIAGEKRVILARRMFKDGGCAVFLRALLPCRKEQLPAEASLYQRHHLITGSPAELYPTGMLLRCAMAETGWRFSFHMTEPGKVPVMTLSRNRGAFILSGFVPDTTTIGNFSTPLGIPIPYERDIRVSNESGQFHFEKTIRLRNRVFVCQKKTSTVSCRTLFPNAPDITDRIGVTGLNEADVRVFPPPDVLEEVEIRTDPGPSSLWSDTFLSPEWEDTGYGRCLILHNISGSLNIGWKTK